MDIERAFRESWSYVEMFYAGQIIVRGVSFLIPLYRTVFVWRLMGYDQKLRAGLSMDSLILSRSKVHGLRPDQAALQIYVAEEAKFTVKYHNGASTMTSSVDGTDSDLVIADELQSLIDRLVEQPID